MIFLSLKPRILLLVYLGFPVYMKMGFSLLSILISSLGENVTTESYSGLN